MKRLTSFMKVTTAEGERIAYTYAEIDPDTGTVIDSNKKGSFVILDEDLASHIHEVEAYITRTRLVD